jgi:ABC-type oligopeptide transport system substrate-binding subunit
MSTRRGWLVTALVTLGLALAGCAATASTGPTEKAKPAKVEAIAGKSVKSVTLTEQADKRLGIETVAIADASPNTVVPYSAVIYSADGKTWVFTVTKPLTYVREQVVVANVGGAQGTEAFLSQSPPVGTTIVKTGAVELYGAELGVGK